MKRNEMVSQEILCTLAQVDPQYPEFVATLPEGLDAEINIPIEIIDNVTTIIREERPELNELVNAYERQGTSAKKNLSQFGIGEFASMTGIMTAMLFLLRTHILVKRDTKGKWVFTYEHKPVDSNLLKKTIEALVGIFNKTKDL